MGIGWKVMFLSYYKRKIDSVLQCLDMEGIGFREFKMIEDLIRDVLRGGIVNRNWNRKLVLKVN